MGWLPYALAWLAAALFWSLASASSAARSPLETLPFGLVAMGSAAVMGIGVWHLTERVSWNWRAGWFYAAHAVALVVYSVAYATSWMWLEVLRDRLPVTELVRSPVLIWNLLMGSWLYLVVAGLSYAIRAHRRVRSHEAAAAEARMLAQQAQLAALRAQINPHFLFNALHSVGALVTSDPARADRALESLGDLLRYALASGHSVAFSEEWAFTGNYLAFERLRLGDRLRVDAAATPETLSTSVPPLILQPIVENAVRHGIADRPEGGTIVLRAESRDGLLVLRVSDDGVGPSKAARTGLGLTSVRRRLAALHGDRASVELQSGAGGCTVTITIPLVGEFAESAA